MSQHMKILLLEDNAADAEIVRRLLNKQEQQFEFRLAMDKTGYLEELDKFKPDIILADNALPQFNATEALEIINKRGTGIPFILVTGTVSEEFAANIIKSGADDYILKDRLARLPAAIEGALKQRRTEKEKKAALDKLKLSENYFRSIIEQFPYPVVTYAPDGTFINANPAWEIMWDDKRENVKGYNIRKDPQMIASGLSVYVEKAFGGEVAESTPYLYEPVLIGKQGRNRWMQMLLYPLKNDQQQLLEVILILLDITSNKEAEKKIRDSEEQYRMLIERVSDGFIALDKDWKYTYVNKRTGEITGRDPKSLIGKYIWDEFPEAVGSGTFNAFNKAMETQQYINNIDYYAPLQLWQENEIYPSPEGLSVFIRDITERKRIEEAIRLNAEQLRELSLHLQDIREEERAAMAREVHDVLGQQLTGFKMDMSWLNRKMKNEDPDIRERISGTIKLIDDTIQTVRKIASDLRPSILDDLGLVAALEWQSEDFEKRSGIKINFTGNLQELVLAPQIAIALFRIYQELLTNVARHANASLVNSSLYTGNGQLHLIVNDNGKGFDMENTGNNKTLGLLGIKERTLLMGGRYEIKSKPGEGTAVLISVPLANSPTNI